MVSQNALKRLSSCETECRFIRTENLNTQPYRVAVHRKTHCITT